MKNFNVPIVQKNALYIPDPTKGTGYDRMGMQSNTNTGFFVYEWNEEQKKYVKLWIEVKNEEESAL